MICFVKKLISEKMDEKIVLKDGGDDFAVSIFQGKEPLRTVLFAVGAGGNPSRHAPLLNMLAEQGCTVIAPHFERMANHLVSAAELAVRIRRIRLALDYASRTQRPIYGVGHSIGSAMLIGLAGGQMWMRDGKRLDFEADKRIERMVVFTPAMDFFAVPGALDEVRIPMQAWAGSLDTITPPAQAVFLKSMLGSLVDARYIESAGHFSFMNELPPNVVDTVDERELFLDQLHLEVSRFLFSSG